MVRVLPCTAALRLRVTGDTRTLPFGPGVAPSSRESSCPLSLTLITLPVFFPLVTFVVDRVAELTFVLVVVPLVVDRVLVLTFVLDVPLVVRVPGGGRSSNGGGVAPG